MPKIVIKHLTGVKAGQVESFELPFDAVTFGRSTDCQVAYDPLKEDLVSRNHLKITPQGEDAFLLTDLNSSNGTLVNDKQVTDPITLYHGDIVQLGKGGGPKLMFELDPPPAAGKTREVQSIAESKSTREAENQAQSGEMRTKSTEPRKQGIGHETFERRIKETETTTRRKMINISAGIFTVIVLVAGYFVYQSQADKQEVLDTVGSSLTTLKSDQAKQLAEMKANAPMSGSEIARLYGPSTVLIETSWKLVHVQSGSQVYHAAICVKKNPNGECAVARPKYKMENGTIQPVLNYESGYPIGGAGSGSGFVVQDKGFILTNRHVVAGWETKYPLPFPGVLEICEGKHCENIPIQGNEPRLSIPDWIPSEAFGKNPLSGKVVHGKYDYLEVTFPKTSHRIPANLVRVSDTADVALIKVDVPQSLQATQLDATTTVSSGDQITVMGYPGISPEVLVRLDSQDFLNQRGEVRTIPEPTVTIGNIGKVFSNTANKPSDVVTEYLSMAGDSYQLTVNATGPGNSGGPVFNDKGYVIGIFTAGIQQGGTMITFAVPIKHGLEIMGIQKTIN